MRNLFFWVVALGMLFTSCQRDDAQQESQNGVVFSVSAPAMDTRAAGDGSKVEDLYYAVWSANEDGTLNEVIVDDGQVIGAFASSNATQVHVPLARNMKYVAIFWAQAPSAPFTLDWASQTITMTDAAFVGQNENVDAFFKAVTFTFDSDESQNVELRRPFAQLNIGTADLAAAEKGGLALSQTAVTVPVAKTLNLLDGSVGTAEEVTYALADLPTETVEIDDVTYDLISINYLLVDGDAYSQESDEGKQLVDVVFSYTEEDNATPIERTFTDITIERNHRTYIVGHLLTEEVNVVVYISKDWESSDYKELIGDETVTVAAPASVSYMDGYERAQVTWTNEEEGVTTNLSWGSEDDESAEVAVTRATGQNSYIINSLAEGDHTVTLWNVDAEGNESERVKVTVHAYGTTYKSALTTRSVSDLAYVGSTKVATPTFDTWNKGLYTVIEYTDATTSAKVEKLVENSATTATCDNVALGAELSIYTVYKPDNCMDAIEGPVTTSVARSIVPINVMQFNVQNINPLANDWDGWAGSRVTTVAALIKDSGADVMGLQELYSNSGYNSLMSKLGNGYAGVTYGRTMGSDREALAIVWKTSKFTLKTHGRFWYNATDKDTAGYTTAGGITAKFERFCVWAILTENTSGIEYFVSTTHLASSDEDKETSDYMQFPLKWTQARWLGANIKSFAKYEESNILRSMIITGDFNCNNNTKPILTGFGTSNHVNASFYDTWDLTTNHTSPDTRDGYVRSTMNDDNGNQQQFTYFDYVFVNKADDPCKLTGKTDSYSVSHMDSSCASAIFDDCKVEVLSHTIHPAKYNNVHMSDHNAVSVQLKYTYPNPE